MNTAFPIPTLETSSTGLRLEATALSDIADQFGTPTYVYSHTALANAFEAYRLALAGRRAPGISGLLPRDLFPRAHAQANAVEPSHAAARVVAQLGARLQRKFTADEIEQLAKMV